MAVSNTLLSPTIIAKEALRLLKNNLVMGNLVYRGYETEFPGMPKVGGSVQIRKPVKFNVTKSRIRVTSTITEQYITLTVATQAHISWKFAMVDMTLTIEEYSNRYIRPAAAALANQVDADLCGLYEDVPNSVVESTGYVTPHTFMVLGKAMQKMDEEAVPPDDRVVVFNPAAHWAFANALSNWNFKEGGEMALRKGHLGRIANADIYMDQNIKTHTVGQFATDGATDSDFIVWATADSAAGGLPTGVGVDVDANAAILIGGFNHSSGVNAGLKQGDSFTIDACFAVNPMSGESTGALRQFLCTAHVPVTDSTTGIPILQTISPQMIHTGPYKTVDTIPQLAAALTFVGDQGGSYPMNLAFHKNAFALVMVPLEAPVSEWGASESEDGISIRVVKSYDIDSDQEIIRMDILYGVKTIYPELATRIVGATAT